MRGKDGSTREETGDKRSSSEASVELGAYLVLVFAGRVLERPQLLPIPREGATIGRATEGENALLRFDDEKISRIHAAITRDRERWWISDRRSKNGTYVAGTRLPEGEGVELDDGEVIRLGSSVLIFRTGHCPTDQDAHDPYLPGLAPKIAAVRARIRSLAADEGPVLIIGDTGTGKELAARALHDLRPNDRRAPAKRPFVPVNCAELDSGTARSDLFGAERGAFTDAKEREGYAAWANGGTLFLDEIAELDPRVQADLLRYVEDGTFRRMGRGELEESSARIIAATNVDLERAAREGRFRSDLLGRLRGRHPILRLPALHERPEDILTWARRLAREDAARLEQMTAEDAEHAVRRSWVEGLREIRRAALNGEWRAGEKTWLREPRASERPEPSEPAPKSEAAPRPTRDAIEATLRATGGNARAAAARLRLERRKLYRLCKTYGIDPRTFRGSPE